MAKTLVNIPTTSTAQKLTPLRSVNFGRWRKRCLQFQNRPKDRSARERKTIYGNQIKNYD